jgi:hypothetical protein
MYHAFCGTRHKRRNRALKTPHPFVENFSTVKENLAAILGDSAQSRANA